MNSFLLNRALGTISPQALSKAQNTRLLHSLQPSDDTLLSIKPLENDGVQAKERDSEGQDDRRTKRGGVAHPAGVNSITIDRFEGRYLLSGGADSSIGIWDLETIAPTTSTGSTGSSTVIPPLNYVSKTARTHNLGITHLSFYPFDSLAFLSSSYDHTLKLYSSETLACSATFDLASVVYSHDISRVASHLLVACATQHPAVRLVDLRSGASTHSLAGHSGAVLSVAWHPKREHILASGGADGLVRLWDVRRSASSLGVLDMDDSVGLSSSGDTGPDVRSRQRGKAHRGAANGVIWDDDGTYIVSCGHDEKIRVWDGASGANTLTNFGPAIKNTHTSPLLPLITPTRLTGPGKELLIYPNPRELLVYEMHTGRLLTRLRTPSHTSSHTAVSAGSGTRNVINRTNGLAWRAHAVEIYSAHSDGTIRCWKPRTWEDVVADEEDNLDGDDDHESRERKRKREELDEIVNSLTKRQVTYT